MLSTSWNLVWLSPKGVGKVRQVNAVLSRHSTSSAGGWGRRQGASHIRRRQFQAAPDQGREYVRRKSPASVSVQPTLRQESFHRCLLRPVVSPDHEEAGKTVWPGADQGRPVEKATPSTKEDGAEPWPRAPVHRHRRYRQDEPIPPPPLVEAKANIPVQDRLLGNRERRPARPLDRRQD